MRVFPVPSSRLAFQTGPSRPTASPSRQGLLPSFVPSAFTVELPVLCRGNVARVSTAVRTANAALPRGPSLRSELFCLGPSSLTGPIRPTCRHISISPHSGLYGMPSLCVSASATCEWFRAFAVRSFSTCRPLCPRGVHRLQWLSSFTDDSGLRQKPNGSALPKLPSSVSDGRMVSRLTGSLSLRPVELLAPLTDLTGHFAQPTGTFTPELSASWSPFSPSGITTVATERFHRWDFHPLERQLASLHRLLHPHLHAGLSRRTRTGTNLISGFRTSQARPRR
jgi:hypothetical protein